jgi:hypothetical protein
MATKSASAARAISSASTSSSTAVRLAIARVAHGGGEVSDAGSTTPHLRRARAFEEGGRGLLLVAQFAERPGRWLHAWLVEDLPGGRVRILTQETQIGQPAAVLANERPNPHAQRPPGMAGRPGLRRLHVTRGSHEAGGRGGARESYPAPGPLGMPPNCARRRRLRGRISHHAVVFFL